MWVVLGATLSFSSLVHAEDAETEPSEEEATLEPTDSTDEVADARWSQPFTLKSCERPASALPGGMEATLATVVTITTPDGVGAGYIASPDGFVFTAAHVVADSQEVKVATYGGPAFPAEIVRLDSAHDVALLHIPGDGHPCLVPPPAPASLGSEIYAIGAPGGEELSHSVSKGIVSGYREWEEHKFIQTDVSLNAGNSGGPLLDTGGFVLGVVSWKVAGLGVEGLSFGIPHSAAVDFLGIHWGEESSDPADGGDLIEMVAVNEIDLPDGYQPIIQRPPDAKPLLPPAKPQRRSMMAPMVTLAAGGVLIAGTWGWSEVDVYTTPTEWTILQGGNALGYGAVAVGGIWTLSNLAWNRSISIQASPIPGGLSVGGSF